MSETKLPPQRRHRRLRQWGMVACVVLGVALVVREQLLRAIAAPLIVAETPEKATSLLLIDGDARYSAVVKFHQQNPAADILILKFQSTRLERSEILPSRAELDLRKLIRSGVDESRIAIVNAVAEEGSPHPTFRQWLVDHPEARVVVLCKSFSSREYRWRFDRYLPKSESERLWIQPLVSREFDESHWWLTKSGAATLVNSWLGLISYLTQNGHQVKLPECNPEHFEPTT